MAPSNPEVLSFDLDGTLVSHDFSTAIWREAIPNLVARQGGLRVEDVKRWVYHQYETVGEGSLEWYNLAYWYERFGLMEDWRETLRKHRPLIRLFPEVLRVLQNLGRAHRLIIISNASHPFIRAEMDEAGLHGIFDHVISATSDLGEVKKTEAFYARVCQILGMAPHEMIHVGDHWEFDYIAPSRAGIRSYFLDRLGQRNGPGVVRDLEAFAREILLNDHGVSSEGGDRVQ